MSDLDRKVSELRHLVGEIIFQVGTVNAAVCHGPHAELSAQELLLVEYLGDSGPRMMRELAEYLRLAVNSLTTIVDKLEHKGMARRQRSDEDRRIVRVELTDSGREVYDGAVEEKKHFLRGMLTTLTEDEQEIFLVLFRKIARSGRSQVQKMSSSA
jgi:DNA-binding MarR family transcriptional regulator